MQMILGVADESLPIATIVAQIYANPDQWFTIAPCTPEQQETITSALGPEILRSPHAGDGGSWVYRNRDNALELKLIY